MSLKIGLIGLPNVGKSTLFNALTKKKVDISNYPFCTIEPNVGVVEVPDDRLQNLAKMAPGAKIIPAVIEMVDVAGLIKGAHKGEGLGNQFLSRLFGMDALLFLIRCFKDAEVVSLADDPKEQLAVLKEELAAKDSELKERAAASKKTAHIFPSLSLKPSLIVCNVRGDAAGCLPECAVTLDAKLELELSEMAEREAVELGLSPALPKLIRAAYQALGLITFYTIKGGRELRAWPIKSGTPAAKAGGIIHGDFEEKFIRAEVIDCEKLLEAGSWLKARESGFMRIEGREYAVRDGDVVEFKI